MAPATVLIVDDEPLIGRFPIAYKPFLLDDLVDLVERALARGDFPPRARKATQAQRRREDESVVISGFFRALHWQRHCSSVACEEFCR